MICFGFTRMNRGSLQFVLFQAPVHQRQREIGSVDRDVDLREEIRHRADVVLVTVGQDHGAEVLLVLFEKA